MSRKSAAALAVSPLSLVPSKRPDPPRDMSEDAKEEWRRIVGSMPADWFTPEMWPILTTLCETTVIYKKVSSDINRAPTRSESFNNLSRSQILYAKIIETTSTKLKLTAQSRHNMNRAHRATKDAVIAQKHKRPWELDDKR